MITLMPVQGCVRSVEYGVSLHVTDPIKSSLLFSISLVCTLLSKDPFIFLLQDLIPVLKVVILVIPLRKHAYSNI